MDAEKRAVRIEVEYADGSMERATGEDAELIWRSVSAAFVMEHIHGRPYQGPRMKLVEGGDGQH